MTVLLTRDVERRPAAPYVGSEHFRCASTVDLDRLHDDKASQRMTPTPDTPKPTDLELPDPDVAPQPASTSLELPGSDTPAATPVISEPADPPAVDPGRSGPLGNLVVDHLRRVEVAMLSRILATTLAAALPPSMVQVERHRTLGDRLAGRPGNVVGVRIHAADKTLGFRAPAVGDIEATVSHTVRGVTLSTTRVPVPEWLDQLAAILDAVSCNDEATRTALQRALLT